MKMNTRKLLSLLLSAGIPLACSGSGPATNGGTQTIVGAKLSDYAASWDGYAEAYTFMPSGSDRVRLTIDAHGQGGAHFKRPFFGSRAKCRYRRGAFRMAGAKMVALLPGFTSASPLSVAADVLPAVAR